MTMKVLSFELMWYSSSVYQIRPNRDSPVPQFCWLKSSTNFAGRLFELVFGVVFALVLATTLAFRLSLWLTMFALFVLLALVALMLAKAIIITTRPIPITPSASSPPRIHQIAFDFFCGAATGIGVHCCCGGGGDGGVGAWLASVSGR